MEQETSEDRQSTLPRNADKEKVRAMLKDLFAKIAEEHKSK